mgnify:CR=1 FL=1
MWLLRVVVKKRRMLELLPHSVALSLEALHNASWTLLVDTLSRLILQLFHDCRCLCFTSERRALLNTFLRLIVQDVAMDNARSSLPTPAGTLKSV